MLELQLGDILQKAGVVDAVGIQQGVEHASATGARLGTALVDLGLVSSDVIAAALGKQHGVTPANEKTFSQIETGQLSLVPAAEAHRLCVIPIGVMRATQELAVAMRDPGNLDAIDTLRAITGKTIHPAVASEGRIRRALTEHYGPAADDGFTAPSDEAPLDLDLGPLQPPTAPELPGMDTAAEPDPVLPLEEPQELPEARVDGDSMGELKRFLGTGAGIAAAVAALVVVIVVFPMVKKIFVRDKGVFVYEDHEASHVGLRVDFPDTGWRYIESEDVTERQMGVTLKGSLYYRGDDPDLPEDALALITARGGIPLAVTDHQFEMMVRDMSRGLGQNMRAGEFRFSGIDCARSTTTTAQLAECEGQGTYRKTLYDLMGYFWLEDGAVVVVLFLTAGEPADFLDEATEILDSIKVM